MTGQPINEPTYDIQTAPKNILIALIIKTISGFGNRLMNEYASSQADTTAGRQQVFNDTLLEIEDLADKMDTAIESCVKDSASLGVVLLSILQVGVWALSHYMDRLNEQASGQTEEELFQEDDIAENGNMSDNSDRGVYLRRKIRGDH